MFRYGITSVHLCHVPVQHGLFQKPTRFVPFFSNALAIRFLPVFRPGRLLVPAVSSEQFFRVTRFVPVFVLAS